MRRLAAFLFLVLGLGVAVGAADEIVLDDGSVVVGKVIKIKGGKLHVKTARMGTVRIDRRAVVALHTELPYTVELDTGERRTGTLTIEEDLLSIQGEDETWVVARIAVAKLDKAAKNHWDNLDLEASGGLNMARGNSRTTSLRLDGRAVYSHRGDTRTRLKFSTTLNEQQNAEDTRRTTLDLSHEYWGSASRFSLDGSVRLEQNEAALLDLRTIGAATAGYRIVKTPRNRFELFGGLAWVSEDFVGTPGDSRFDGIVGLEYRLSFARTRFDTVAVVLPSTGDRILVQLDSKLRIELVKNLDFDVTFWDRYDSNPPVATDEHDYGLTIGLGWSN